MRNKKLINRKTKQHYTRMAVLLSFSLFVPFLILEVHHGVTIPQGQHHVSSAQQSQVLFGGDSTWMGDHIRIPRVVITFFLFSSSFFKAILRRAELPSLCNVVCFPIYQLFVPHFVMAVSCVYRINKQRDTSFEFSSILSTVDLSKHLIMVESFENSYSSSVL